MHIVLDSNIYAADYLFTGAAFRALFDYIVRTESKLILPRIIREEVVAGFGRRLKKESKELFEVYRRYKLLDIRNDASFTKPNVRKAMIDLRRKLMKPSGDVASIYIAETESVSIDEVFMRGIHRTRPASDDGEELRDVIIWLWVRGYCVAKKQEDIVFVTQDKGFWSADEPHQHILGDIKEHEGHLSIFRTIDDFLKKHAPAPSNITPEWFAEHFERAHFEQGATLGATARLSKTLSGVVRDVHLDEFKFVSGSLYCVAPGVEFTELNLSLSLSLTNIVSEHPLGTPLLGGLGGLFGSASVNPFGFGKPSPGSLGFPARSVFHKEDPPLRETVRQLQVRADARFSARIKEGKVAEVSLDALKIDQSSLFSQLYKKET
jgi:hypothetical protein